MAMRTQSRSAYARISDELATLLLNPTNRPTPSYFLHRYQGRQVRALYDFLATVTNLDQTSLIALALSSQTS